MGYYTQYSLKQLRNAIPNDTMTTLIAGDECASYALDSEGDTKAVEKWYEHERSLRAWSAQYPDTLLVLHAEGEDSDGIWEKYFLRGKLIHTESFSGLAKVDPDAL